MKCRTAGNAVLGLLFCLANAGLAFAQADSSSITQGNYRKLQSKTLGEERTLLIRLPEDYETSKKRYAVLYKLDGGKEIFLQTVSAVYYLVDMTDRAPDHIVVGIENTNRNRDMTAGEGAGNFIRFIRTELIPFIDSNYRTNGFRILCGQSLSSVFAAYSFVKQPELFDAYVLGSFGLSKEGLDLFEAELRLSAGLRRSGDKYVFVSNGKLDSYDPDGSRTRNGAVFMASLRKAVPGTVSFEYRVYDDEGHVPFPTIYEALKWIYSHAEAPR